MPSIGIITDTNSSLPPEIAEKYHIIQVPIMIQFDEESYTTGLDINDAKLFEMVNLRKALPTTAAPSPAAFQAAFQQAFDRGSQEIICVCCSSKVSATYNAACMAAGMFPGKSISVVDSLQLSLAEGFQVLTAAEAASESQTRENILTLIQDVLTHTHVYAALPTLKYLAMGGRMGKLAAGFGDTLEIKPILTSNEGKLELLEKVRTLRKAKQRLVDLALESTGGVEVKRIGLFHVNNPDGARALYEALKDSLPISVEPIVAEFTPGLSVHAGSGVVGFTLIT